MCVFVCYQAPFLNRRYRNLSFNVDPLCMIMYVIVTSNKMCVCLAV